eukprot:45486-Prymnesium_polylepis.1
MRATAMIAPRPASRLQSPPGSWDRLGLVVRPGVEYAQRRRTQGLCSNVGTLLEHPALTPLLAHC